MTTDAAPIPIDDALLRAWPLPQPDDDADKDERGRVVVLAGSREVPGAAILAARSALRAGAGKVLLATVESAAMAIAVHVPELRVIGLPETTGGAIVPASVEQLAPHAQRADVLLIGPGMLDDSACSDAVCSLLALAPEVPAILDAAAITAAAMARPPRSAEWLATPHAGELARATGGDRASIEPDPHAAAGSAARLWHAVVALKGKTTVIAHPDGRVWEHCYGHAGLATAGSGDVLAGLIAGYAARGASLSQAAAWGVALHARAGARLAARQGSLGFLAGELAAEVPALMESLCSKA